MPSWITPTPANEANAGINRPFESERQQPVPVTACGNHRLAPPMGRRRFKYRPCSPVLHEAAMLT
jgi:hypothetical protein